MKAIRTRLGIDRQSDDGVSLIEVVVAMMIFALVSTGLLYSMIRVISVDRDSRIRQVAANLAAEEIDRAREVEDILDLVSWSTSDTAADPQDPTRPIGPLKLNGDTFYIDRNVEWVSDSSSTESCGASAAGTTLRYKQVNVRVTWDRMSTGAQPVQSDSLINPREKVNDPSKGTILVSVKKRGGVAVEGATITATPAFAIAPAATDEQGCTYVFKVSPGTYTLTLTKAGYVDNFHIQAPTKVVNVTPGKVEKWTPQYDQGVAYELQYPNLQGAERPSNLDISFIGTAGVATKKASQGKSDRLMHPDGLGYKIVAGDAAVCPAADPSNWTPGPNGTKQVVAPEYRSAAPGANVTAPIAMGVVQVDKVNGDEYIKIVSASATGHPACTSELTYIYPKSKKDLAVPYGSWKFYRVDKNGNSFALNNGFLNGILGNAGVVTIDPRSTP